MKKIIILAYILLVTSVAQAENLKISVDNRSSRPITIQKFDGLLVIPAKTKLENQLFKANEIVTNYVDGKKKCTWELKTDTNKKYVISGIFYSTETYNGRVPIRCTIIVNILSVHDKNLMKL